jgi:hypothetical protein
MLMAYEVLKLSLNEPRAACLLWLSIRWLLDDVNNWYTCWRAFGK